MSGSVVNEIKLLIDDLYIALEPEYNRLVFLDVIGGELYNKDMFYEMFLDSYNEIRSDIKKIKYFISGKQAKLVKESKKELPLLNILDNFSDDTTHKYWENLHKMYLLLEHDHPDKDERVLNTIVVELQKKIEHNTTKAETLATKEKVESEITKENKRKLREAIKNKLPGNLHDITDRLKNDPNVAKMLEKLQDLSGNELDNDPVALLQQIDPNFNISKLVENLKDMNNPIALLEQIKQLNPELFSKFGLDSIMSNDMVKTMMNLVPLKDISNNINNYLNMETISTYLDKIPHEYITTDLVNYGLMILNSPGEQRLEKAREISNELLEKLKTTINSSIEKLSNRIYKDILNILQMNLKNDKNIDKILLILTQYSSLVLNKSFTNEEFLAAICNIFTNDKMYAKLTSTEPTIANISIPELIVVVTKVLPKGSLEKFGIGPDFDLNKLIELVKSYFFKKQEQIELTDQQKDELEEYFNKISKQKS